MSAEMTKRMPWNNILVNRYLSERQANVWLLDEDFKNTKHKHGWVIGLYGCIKEFTS